MAKRTQTRFLARTIEGSRPSEMPGFVPPQLASLRTKEPSGDGWLHEIKYDGYRLQTHLNGGRVKVYTRNGLDWTAAGEVSAHRLRERPERGGRAALGEARGTGPGLHWQGRHRLVAHGFQSDPETTRHGSQPQIEAEVSPKSKLTKPIRAPKATWVEAAFVAEIEYRDITAEGLLRASPFKGLSKA